MHWLQDLDASLGDLRPSNDPRFVRRLHLVLLGDALAMEGRRGVTEFLRVEGIDGRAGDAALHPLLHAVTQDAYRALLELLLVDGVDLDETDADGYTPLAWAANHADAETLALLVRLRSGRRPLHGADGSR